MAEHIPIKIQWELIRPKACVNDSPIHLDDLLAWAVVDRERQAGRGDDPGLYSAAQHLPLAKHETMGNVWMASMLTFEVRGPIFFMPMVKRFDLEQFVINNGLLYTLKMQTINSAGGRFKAYDMRVPLQWCTSATAYCIGDREEIKKLLSRVSNLGKFGRHNLGLVKSFTIEEDPEAQDKWRYRALPLLDVNNVLPGYAAAWGRAWPPYWLRTDRQRIQVPCE